MKKSFKIILGLTLMIIPLNVKAFSGSASISCGKTQLYPGETTNCSVSGYSDGAVNGVSGNITTSGSISITNASKAGGWEGNIEGGSVGLYTDTNKSGGFGIATVTIKANSVGTGTISYSSIGYSDEEFTTHSISSTSTTITIKEKEQAKPTTPATNPSTPSTNNNTSTNNTTNSETEDNKKSNDATLKSLTISEGKINFDKNKTEYNIEVSNDIEKITLKAEANNSKSKVTLPNDLSLKLGKNAFEIKVEAEDKTTKIYKINVTRLERKLSSNSKLKSIEIKGYDITLEENKYVYDLKNIKTSTLDIKAIAEDETSSVKIYGDKYIGKDDTIVIKVEAEDGTISNYIIYANNSNINENNSNNIPVYIIVIVLAIISLGISVAVIVKSKKKNKNNF